MPTRLSTRRSISAAILVGLFGSLVADPAGAQSSLQPPGWDDSLKLAEAADLNPDPEIVEIALEARVAEVEIAPGERVVAWTYNGALPGPLIRVRVGNRLIVHLSNQLPQPTTIHWHGLRVPFAMDGVPGVSQPAIEPGESFVYDFVVPDAGLYWYHPHVLAAAQVGFGLYGALLVEDPTERTGVADDLVLVLSDIAIDETGKLESPDSGGNTATVFGREGNHALVNGREWGELVVRSGAPQRWRIVNAAKSRYFHLYLEGLTFTKIGADGGLLEYAVESDRFVIPAGERLDVIVTPKGEPGAELILRSLPHDRGYGSTEFRANLELLTLKVADMPPHVLAAPLPTVTRAIEPLSTVGATPVDVELTITKLRDGNSEYGLNGVKFAGHKPLLAKNGETQVWTITNSTPWSHPIHLHGFFFQILDEQGSPVRPLAWKDTVDVPSEQTRRMVVSFDDRSGSWMYHCHILDHAEGGMMGFVDLGVTAGVVLEAATP